MCFLSRPYVAEIVTEEGRTYTHTALTPETLAQADCVIICTRHTNVDYGLVLKHAPLIVDMRNALPEGHAHVYKF